MHVATEEQKNNLRGYCSAEIPEILGGKLTLQVKMPFLKGTHVATG